jgi:hypothetical protein
MFIFDIVMLKFFHLCCQMMMFYHIAELILFRQITHEMKCFYFEALLYQFLPFLN